MWCVRVVCGGVCVGVGGVGWILLTRRRRGERGGVREGEEVCL